MGIGNTVIKIKYFQSFVYLFAAPETVEPSNEPVVIALGDSFSFRCENKDGKIPSWYKDGDEVLNDVGNAVVVPFNEGGTWGSDLTVKPATFGDAGVYECRNAAESTNWDSVEVEVVGELEKVQFAIPII